MLIKLNNLNESLEKKYLIESEELTETMADMPKWLKDRILTTKYTRNDGQHRHDYGVKKQGRYGGIDRDAIDAKNPEAGPRPTYTNARGEDKYADKSLFAQLLAHGINMDTVDIIEGDMPTKRTDPRMKEPNIPIFLFPNGQVYAQGINENEEYSGDGSYKPFKHMPKKTLLSTAVAFAYIDGTKDDNFKVKDKQAARLKDKQNTPQNYNRNKADAGRTNWNGELMVDKSGYKVIKSVDKYRDQLAELKCAKIYDIMQEKEDYLKEVKEELANIFLNTGLRDMHDENPEYKAAFTGYENIYEEFVNAVNAYNACLSRLDNITNNENWDDAEKRSRIASFINYDSSYDRLNEKIKQIEKMAPTVFNSIIDWI